MKGISCATLLIVFVATAGCAQRTAQTVPDDAALVEFHDRVRAYVELRDRVSEGLPRLEETAEPEEITETETALAERVREARSNAKRGDIFTPAVRERFRQLLNPELRGLRGQNTRGIIMDENPSGFEEFPFKVNSVYPKQLPLGTVPPNILESLPPLPENLEYRFVDTHLILRDMQANLIVDFIPYAIS